MTLSEMPATPQGILLVDDQPENLQLLSDILSGHGYKLFPTRSGPTALRWLSNNLPELVLLDVRMPDMDGFEVCRRIKSNPVTRDVPVIFVSALHAQSDIIQGFELGGVDYITKPVQPAEVLARVQTHINLRRLQFNQQAQTQALQAANIKLQELSKLKDEFFASVSHELRTPLSAILNTAEILLEELYGPLTPQQIKSIRRLEESGRHLLRLINDILDVAKAEAGKIKLEFSEVSVQSLCEACLDVIKEPLHKKNLRLRQNCDPHIKTLYGDGLRLKQILLNLLDNAVKFTPEGGEIGLEIQAGEDRQEVRLTVWDTGIGIDPDMSARLFQPFVQLDSGLGRHYGGTGLGLALVKNLTILHGGSITLESRPGTGSRFSVALPWGQAAMPATPDAGNKAFSVLVLEDRCHTRDTLSSYLDNQGYTVLEAGDSASGIKLAYQYRPDLIIMDIHMPGMDGLETIRRIRAAHDLHDIPIAALTALVLPGDKERCLAAGANAYLSKPVVFSKLQTTIDSLLKH